ncbi:MAG: BlaI/MecI/CopY family transcriptional regulator [Candidatus Bathyarchaeota archaeon]|nr:BlaI/MecI/CopY family transcriptional regulator [Candidatus Bathyarchaeota archaeon]
MKSIVFDTSKTGFHAVLRDWQIKAMQAVWNNPEGVNSRMVHQKVNQVLKDESISRASAINFLEDLRELGVLTGEENTGKGGHHWVYFPAMDESGFKQFIVKKMIDSLMESFPDEAREAIRK